MGEIAGAYGPHFIRLEVPGHKGIGIHGTHKPESIGTRDTEGCVRLNNNDIEELINYVSIGMVVVIIPSQYGFSEYREYKNDLLVSNLNERLFV